MKSKISFIVLNTLSAYYAENVNPARIEEYLRFKNIPIILQQFNINDETIIKNIIKAIPKDVNIIGFSIYDINSKYVYKLAHLLKKRNPKYIIVVSSSFATTSSSLILNECDEIDLVILGDGEMTIYDLVLKIEENDLDFSNMPHVKTRNDVVVKSPRYEITEATSKEIQFEEYFGVNTFSKNIDKNERNIVNYGYGPTSYTSLDDFFKKHPFSNEDHLVDFGCGKGRVLIMAAFHGCSKITGYEINNDIFNLLSDNIAIYNEKFRNKSTFDLINMDVSEGHIDVTTNKFFFYNPFHLKIIIKTINKILESLSESMRSIEIIFHYPLISTVKYMDELEMFQRKEIIHKYHEKAENDYCFIIYSNK